MPEGGRQGECAGASTVERNEFEPAVPILEKPDDNWLFGLTTL
jgi:hypothetical protein